MSSEKYFLYSQEQFNEKNEIMGKLGKSFVPGTVVVNGERKKYTQLSEKASIDRFVDTKIVAQGDPNTFTYTKPTFSTKGN